MEETTQKIEILKEITKVAGEVSRRGIFYVTLEEQLSLGTVMGSILHEKYCKDRNYEPRAKTLEKVKKDGSPDPKEAEFINKVLTGEIPTSETLRIVNGEVIMDIANTPFAELSPFWQRDNYMAGCAAIRSILTSWSGLMHNNPEVKKHVEVAVANAIHESWIARGNVGNRNKELETSYINLPLNEQTKDLEHLKMAKGLVNELVKIAGIGQALTKTAPLAKDQTTLDSFYSTKPSNSARKGIPTKPIRS